MGSVIYHNRLLTFIFILFTEPALKLLGCDWSIIYPELLFPSIIAPTYFSVVTVTLCVITFIFHKELIIALWIRFLAALEGVALRIKRRQVDLLSNDKLKPHGANMISKGGNKKRGYLFLLITETTI